jgi:Lrp/AsnC family leucine-responsive transcriptional regulator
MKLDEIDLQILDCLEENGRITYALLAKRVGLTSTAVGQRIQKMIDEELILGFGITVDRKKLGISIQAIISLRLDFAKLDAFNRIVKTMNEIEFCYRVTGEDCMIMKVNLTDNAHLLHFINTISMYGNTKSNIIIEQAN